MCDELSHQLFGAIDSLYSDKSVSKRIKSEEDLRRLLCEQLAGSTNTEVPFFYAPPRHPWPEPPAEALAVIERLPRLGFDPIARQPKLDVLWEHEQGPVVLELKLAKNGEWDIYGYEILCDMYRLERATTVGRRVTPVARFAVLVSLHERWWKGRKPSAPQIVDGTTLTPGHRVQFTQDSLKTCWGERYAPFFLANAYRLDWRTLVPGQSKCLIVPVEPQR